MSDVVPPADKVTVTVFVEISPADAFAVFTGEIDQWWRRGPAYRVAGKRPGVLHLEPKLGGRLFEEYHEGAAVHEVGTITAWDPPIHLAFEWRSITFVPGEVTRVDVRFVGVGHGTRVTLEHRGWSRIRDDHPVRHGKAASAFLADLGRWWGALLSSLREHTAETRAG
ncbi:MAG TPA: SRPBCC domain-containing protein [Kofleriaceae bacterium]|nr:SRPBCC domain-containing protein [Kofleriaceae bacterium]